MSTRLTRRRTRCAKTSLITQQAQIIAYIDDYKLLMIATLAVVLLLVIFKRPAVQRGRSRGCGAIVQPCPEILDTP
jgi:hypothetical protein